MAYQHSYPKPESGVLVKVVAVFLGIAVGVLALVAIVLLGAANDARDEAAAVATTTGHSAHTPDSAVSLPLNSFAGVVPENARGAGQGATRR